MQTRDKLIRQTAKELGLSIRAVEQIVKAQCVLVRKTIKNKEDKSVYLRGVGTFIPRSVMKDINTARVEWIKKKKQQSKNQQDEDPLEFD